MKTKKILTTTLTLIIFQFSFSQDLTKEDFLKEELEGPDHTTAIAGYGEAKYEYNIREKTARANLTRAVLFVGHKFNDKISFFSELEVEDAKVIGGKPGGEIALEQAFLKFSLNKDINLAAGLLIPRIGIINENHLPTTFNGNDRPYLESLLIPTTWRELGLCIYGKSNKITGLNYSLGLVNGLNSEGFEYGTGIREGRFEGRDASASNIAITGALLYFINNFRIQISGYYGGSAGLNKMQSDTLHLSNGAFGTPVMLTEANIQYGKKGFSFRAIGTMVQINDAEKINHAYDNNIAKKMLGAYAEIGYNLLKLSKKETQQNLTLFGRYEYIDLNYEIAKNGINNDYLKNAFFIAGISYQPIIGVIIKADYVTHTTGEPNPHIESLLPAGQTFYRSNNFFNLGIGYSF